MKLVPRPALIAAIVLLAILAPRADTAWRQIAIGVLALAIGAAGLIAMRRAAAPHARPTIDDGR